MFPEPLPIGKQLETYYLSRYRSLPPETRTLLLIRAADASQDDDGVRQAAALLNVPIDADAPAVDADLLDDRDWLRFRHSLVRSAIYSGAPTAEKRRVHRALADVTNADHMPERRAWHRAAASTCVDEEVAAELERVAKLAGRRGGLAAEAIFRTRSAHLTPRKEDRSRRLLDAAQAAFVAGIWNQARSLLDEAADITKADSPLLEARIRRLRALLNWSDLSGDAAAIHFQTAQAIEPHDARYARHIYLEALEAALLSGSLTRRVSPTEIARAALQAPLPPGGLDLSDKVLQAVATRTAIGFEESVPLFRDAIDGLCSSDWSSPGPARWGLSQVFAAWDMWDADRAGTLLERMERLQRKRGELDSLRITLQAVARNEFFCGDLSSAAAHSAEAIAITAAVEREIPNLATWKAMAAARLGWIGRDAEAREAILLLMGDPSEPHGQGSRVTLALYSLAMLEMAQCNFAEACDACWRLYEADEPPNGNLTLPWLVEAALRSGNEPAAECTLNRLEGRTMASGTVWATGLLARSRALTCRNDEAESLFDQSLSLLSQSPVRTDLAYAHLLYGEWLRRQKRRGDARRELRVAHDMYSQMGGRSFAERAAQELALTGELNRVRPSSLAELTPQEDQIAQLAAQGDTNAEIAARLYISANTVDYHLRKVFKKLGVASRRELRRTLT